MPNRTEHVQTKGDATRSLSSTETDLLEKMAPTQLAEIFGAGIVNNGDDVRTEFLESVKARLAARIEAASAEPRFRPTSPNSYR